MRPATACRRAARARAEIEAPPPDARSERWARVLLPAPLVLVTSFTCHVKAEKEAELQVSLRNLIGRIRALPGCLACRLVAAAEDPRALTLIHEWSDRRALHRFLDSAEYRVLKGMRFLMDQEPRLAVDEVVTRAMLALSFLIAAALGPAVAFAQAPARPAPAGGPSQRMVAASANATYTGDLEGMVKRRVIRVATAYNRTHYFIDRGVQRGLAYEAFKLFEDELNTRRKTGTLRVHVVMVPMSREEMLPSLTAGKVDLVAAGLTVTDERRRIVDFSAPTITGVDEILVSAPDAPAIANADALSGRTLFVRASSSYAGSVQRLNERLKAAGKPPAILKDAPETLEDEDILEMVNAGLVTFTIVDSYLATFWKQLLPKIALHPDVAVATGGSLAVAMRKNSPQLQAEIDGWIKRYGAKTMFGNMMVKRYLRSTEMAKSATGGAEMARFKQVADLFRKYGEQYQLDALLMAAQGFQESGLDQSAKSAVGAVGVMQVMPATGAELKVGDIHQVEPNVHAGVKYIRFMIDKYFADEPMDRLNKGLFAFASYNAGPGRVRQLRREAERRGLNPNVWFNNVERIASERIGRETVQYVSNIYKYYVAYRLALDEQAEKAKDRGAPPSPQ